MAVRSLSLIFRGLNIFFSNKSTMLELNIVSLNSIEFNYIILADGISLTFIGIVTLIASCVVFYRKDYIRGDPNINRFIILVFIFVISIMALIIRPNIIRILLGWDGLGLVSYALVIYYQNVKSFNAGMLTALSNRIGDVIILISIALISSLGSFNFLNLIVHDMTKVTFITSLIVIAACTKSAQIPFSAWLPAAIAAPTPVSALVHSSTLVTAGVYLLIRFRTPLTHSGLNKPLFLVAILTMLMAGIGANIEIDIKKIIALSTLSQLGLIIIRIGLGLVKLAYFHILSHALFKALLFICAGNIIHCSGDNQDLRKIGLICSQMPLTRACLNTANLALCGTPFIAGFYSKDIILESIIMLETNSFPIILAYVATALTVTYSLRLRCYCLLWNPNNKSLFSLSDASQHSNKAILPLATLSVVGGAVISWVIFPTPELRFIEGSMKLLILPTLLIGLILGVAIWISRNSITTANRQLVPRDIIGNMWYLPSLVTRGYGLSSINLGLKSTQQIDRGWFELISVKWLASFARNQSSFIQSQNNSFIKTFLITFLMWFIISAFLINCTNSLITKHSLERAGMGIALFAPKGNPIWTTKMYCFYKLLR